MMTWLRAFSESAAGTDKFIGDERHVALLTAGVMGEVGSVLAELKKKRREREAYPAYRHRVLEEMGDVLWYFVRLVAVTAPHLLDELDTQPGPENSCEPSVVDFLDLGIAAGRAVAEVAGGVTLQSADADKISRSLRALWSVLTEIAARVGIDLCEVANGNVRKIESRWPTHRTYAPLFDVDAPEEDQLPRRLQVEFRERMPGVVVLRCNDINFGDRLTDNIEDPDFYRYHDIFHLAHAVHLGWSPVMRALLRAKRKSDVVKDEAQDGARAGIIEEAVSAIVFSRAKEIHFFEGIDQLDYDILKTIAEFVRGYEVECIPLWQWEMAILDGYRIFRLLRKNRGGTVFLDLVTHSLNYREPTC